MRPEWEAFLLLEEERAPTRCRAAQPPWRGRSATWRCDRDSPTQSDAIRTRRQTTTASQPLRKPGCAVASGLSIRDLSGDGRRRASQCLFLLRCRIGILGASNYHNPQAYPRLPGFRLIVFFSFSPYLLSCLSFMSATADGNATFVSPFRDINADSSLIPPRSSSTSFGYPGPLEEACPRHERESDSI